MDENTGRIVAPASAGDSEASPRPWRVERGWACGGRVRAGGRSGLRLVRPTGG